MRHALTREGVDVYAGYRGQRDVQGGTQVSPDAMVCVVREGGTTLPAYLELEFASDGDLEWGDKLRPYLLHEKLTGETTRVLFVVGNEEDEERVHRLGRDLRVLLTTTYDRLLSGTSRGDERVWLRNGALVSIDFLARHADGRAI